jgi:hypothetical protein
LPYLASFLYMYLNDTSPKNCVSSSTSGETRRETPVAYCVVTMSPSFSTSGKSPVLATTSRPLLISLLNSRRSRVQRMLQPSMDGGLSSTKLRSWLPISSRSNLCPPMLWSSTSILYTLCSRSSHLHWNDQSGDLQLMPIAVPLSISYARLMCSYDIMYE